MSKRYFIGVDPGASGSICAINEECYPVLTLPLKDQSIADVRDMLKMLRDAGKVMSGALEKVHAMPKQGVSSTFKFGASYGGLMVHLECAYIRYELVTPHKWQADLGCLSRGDKNVTKRKAQQMFPELRVTHAIADGLLLAMWALNHGVWKEEPDERLEDAG